MVYSLAIVCLALVSQAPRVEAADRSGGGLLRERAAILATEAKVLKELADRLQQAGKGDLAAQVRERIETSSGAGPTRFVPLPEVVTQPAKVENLVPAAVTEARKQAAVALFELARRAGSPTVKRFAVADRLLRDVLERDPDHAESRRLIGYLPYKGGWATPHAREMLEQRGLVFHPTFGWVAPDWPAHLDRGELPGRFDARGRAIEWKPAAEVDAQHASWETAWKISTAPHFFIQTDVPLAEAIIFGRRLEDLYQLFFAEFADLIGPEFLPMAQRFRNPRQQPVATPKTFQVFYFAGKTEYVEYFRSHFGKDEALSLGYYMPTGEATSFAEKPRSYFYKDQENPIIALSTLHHEASHQILFESAGRGVDGRWPNFWLWEGLGTYFETLAPQSDGSILIGTLSGPRVAAARSQILVQNKYVPLATLAAMDKNEFLSLADDAVYRHYAESMVLTIFFLNGEGGRYREAYIDLLYAAYRRRQGPKALSEKLRLPFPRLDQEFKVFLKP